MNNFIEGMRKFFGSNEDRPAGETPRRLNPVIITIRYSVLQNNPNAWILGRNNEFEVYKAKLFDPARLDSKFHLFKNVVVESLLKQTAAEAIHLVVLTSTDLPKRHMDQLSGLIADTPRSRISLIAPDAGISHRAPLDAILRENKVGLYAHVRLDDDDALSLDYAERLQSYISEENVGRGVSFGSGFGGIFNEKSGRYSEFRELYYPKVSCGMAAVNKFDPATNSYASPIRTAYELGSHTKADQKTPIILDSVKPAFLYSIYDSQDTASDMLRVAKVAVEQAAVTGAIPLAAPVLPSQEK